MRAAVLQGHTISTQELPDPVPGPGELLVRPLFTGICGSDLSFRKQMAALVDEAGGESSALPRIVPGHEFCAELIEIGPGTQTPFRLGTRLTAVPFAVVGGEMKGIGFDPEHGGGLASLCRIDAVRAFEIPEDVPSDLAALTEPLAVGRHAINLANRNPSPNLVVGCGPVGLAVIFALKAEGRGPIIAADFSAERRKAAAELGADIVLDPALSSPYEKWDDVGFTPYPSSPILERDMRQRPPGTNIFECTGAPGVLDQVVQSAPIHSHIIVAGVCPHQEKITPLMAIMRELTVDFSFAYRPDELEQSIGMIRQHPDLVAKFITSRLPLDETANAFDRLSKNPHEVKVLINPQL